MLRLFMGLVCKRSRVTTQFLWFEFNFFQKIIISVNTAYYCENRVNVNQ